MRNGIHAGRRQFKKSKRMMAKARHDQAIEGKRRKKDGSAKANKKEKWNTRRANACDSVFAWTAEVSQTGFGIMTAEALLHVGAPMPLQEVLDALALIGNPEPEVKDEPIIEATGTKDGEHPTYAEALAEMFELSGEDGETIELTQVFDKHAE